MKRYYTSPFLILFVLISATLVLIFVANKYILTVDFYERNGHPISGIPDTESLVYDHIKKAVYLYTVIYLVVKVFVISILLTTALYFFDIRVSFRELLRVVILCEFIFVIPAVVKIWWFWEDRNIVDLATWQNYYFLSASSIFPDVKPAFLLPMQTLNVFEVAYWFLLAGGIEKICSVRFGGALKIVGLSYIPGLFIWVSAVVYFTIVYYPQSY